MIRGIFLAVGLLSVLLLAATILLRVRSERTRDVFTLRYAKQDAC